VVLAIALALAVVTFVGVVAAGPFWRAIHPPPSGGPIRLNSPRPTTTPSPPPRLPTLTLDAIFDHPPDLSRIDPSRVVTMVVTGDIIPGRTVNSQMTKKHDFLWPFRQTSDYLRSGDFVFVNLEAPLVNGCPVTEHGMSFCGDPQFIDGLKYAGVTVANLSNNHSTNYGPSGTASTEKLLSDSSIQYCGLGFIAHLTVKGVRFAFLGFNGVTGGHAHLDRAEIAREISLARPTADVLIAQYHWGKEYVMVPQVAVGVANDDPKDIGPWTIDQGADLVIGNHPHAVQGVQVYKGKLITFAHGNFVFDQMWTPDPGLEDPRNGVVGKYLFVDGQLAGVTYRPTRIYDYGQPRFITGPYADYVMSLMKASSQAISDGTVVPPPSPPVPAPG
jgi:poly-gamma-glutamate synthesis protein (capsule biosynthesis protein)